VRATTLPVRSGLLRLVVAVLLAGGAASTTTSPARAAGPGAAGARTATAMSHFTGTWSAHTSYVTVRRSGRAHESIGDGCCDPVIDVWYRLRHPHRVDGGWNARATVTRVRLHDWPAGTPAPRVGHRYTVRVRGHHYFGVALPRFHFCSPRTPIAQWDCGA
jgi:hypothetical protein